MQCHCLIQGKSFEAELRIINESRKQDRALKTAAEKAHQERLNQLQVILDDIANHRIYDPEYLVDLGFIEEAPSVIFLERRFQFTGKMNWGPRSKAIAEIVRRGGNGPTSKNSLRDIDYLVLGEDSKEGWTARSSKLSDLISKKFHSDGEHTQIILESDFVAALGDTNIE